mgnify:CR=1 FL=1
MDGDFAFACYKETAVKNGIKKGAHVDAERMEEIRDEDGASYAFQVALKYVSAKMRTRKEIEKKLKEKQIEEKTIAATIEKLAGYGYIDDAEYARLYVAELSHKYGEKMILNKLFARGIDGETARAAAAGAGKAEVLKQQMEQLEARYSADEPRKKQQKMIRALMARGFAYDDIRRSMPEEDDAQ